MSATLGEVAHDPSICRNQTYLGYEAFHLAHLPIQDGGLELTSSDATQGQPTLSTKAWSWYA